MLTLHYTTIYRNEIVITKYCNNLYKTSHLHHSVRNEYFTTKIYNFELKSAHDISILDFNYHLFVFISYGDDLFKFNEIYYTSTDIIELFTSMISENSVKNLIQNTTKNELDKLHSTLPPELVLLVKEYL